MEVLTRTYASPDLFSTDRFANNLKTARSILLQFLANMVSKCYPASNALTFYTCEMILELPQTRLRITILYCFFLPNSPDMLVKYEDIGKEIASIDFSFMRVRSSAIAIPSPGTTALTPPPPPQRYSFNSQFHVNTNFVKHPFALTLNIFNISGPAITIFELLVHWQLQMLVRIALLRFQVAKLR